MLGSSVKTHWWSREHLLLIILVGIVLYIPGVGPWRDVLGANLSGQSVGLFDRDEPRFATAARNMLQTGDYIVPRFNGELRPDKPPLVYWVMTAAYRMVGTNELGARLPSAFFSILTLIVIYFAAGSRFGALTGIVSALMLAACSLFVAESRCATADATMMFFISVCMATAWNAWEAGNPPRGGILPKLQYLVDHQQSLAQAETALHPRRLPLWQALVFWVALAAGTLTKGVPLAFVLVPMIMLSIATGGLVAAFGQWRKQSIPQRIIHLPSLASRAILGGNWGWWRQLRPLAGFPLLLVLAGWWFVAAWIATDGELISRMFGTHFIIRVFGEHYGSQILAFLHIHASDLPPGSPEDPMKAYRQPPGFYFVTTWVTFWPWTPLLIPGAFYLMRRVRGKTALAIDRRPYQFILAWIVPMWIILELSRGKLLNYILPVYLAMIILCADMLVASWHRLTDVMAARWLEYARWCWMCVWFALGIAALTLPGYFVHDQQTIGHSCTLLAGFLFAAGVATAMAWGKHNWPYITVFVWTAALLIGNTTVAPNIEELRVSQRVIERIRPLEARGFAYGAMGYEEPTLVFYSTHKVPMPTPTNDWQKKIDAFFAPGPKTNSTSPADFGIPGKAMALIVNDDTLDRFKREGRTFYTIDPAFPFFRRPAFPLLGIQGKPDANVTIITNIKPTDLNPPAATQSETRP